MVEITASIEKVSEIASTSSAFVGFLGGCIKAFTNGTGLRDGLIKIVTGCTVAWVSSPVAVRYLPSELYPPAMFMLGFGGIEFITFVKNIVGKILESRAEAIVDKLFGVGTHGRSRRDLSTSTTAPQDTTNTVRQETLPAQPLKRSEPNVI